MGPSGVEPRNVSNRGTASPEHLRRVCVIGSGLWFVGGLSYYTWRLATALSSYTSVSVVLMRRLIPRFLYPGRARVGEPIAHIRYPEDVPVFDGVDWFLVPGVFRAMKFMRRRKATLVLFQWWTGAVLHTYAIFALAARLTGARVIVEFHEVLDPGEAGMPGVRLWSRLFGAPVRALADGFVFHSEYDRRLLSEAYRLPARPSTIIPHGPYDHYALRPDDAPLRPADSAALNLLWFGTIRPYKGVEDIIRAFDSLEPEDARKFWVTVVGETWEGWTLPGELIEASRYRDRITFVNRYVDDREAARWFAGADALVLPYRRSSSSGPLHIGMSLGLPILVTEVGGLIEAAADYKGALLVEPRSPAAIAEALPLLETMAGRRYQGPHSWDRISASYLAFFDRIEGTSVAD